MLIVQEGDLFQHATAPCIIAHGVNAQGKMNSGFAKQLRRLYPQAYIAYHQFHLEEPLSVGDMIIVVCETPKGKVHICHCVTQEYYGRDKNRVYVDYAAVDKTLRAVADYARKTKLHIHLPFIGGGLANGKHVQLMSIFRQSLNGVSATLWVDYPPR